MPDNHYTCPDCGGTVTLRFVPPWERELNNLGRQGKSYVLQLNLYHWTCESCGEDYTRHDGHCMLGLVAENFAPLRDR